MSLKNLLKKAVDFDMPEEQIRSTEDGRLDFISKFPLEKLNELTVDDYVQGTDENSFCYWLEFKNILLGIGGGNASKFGLYKAKDGNYYSGSKKNKKTHSGDELKATFEAIKNGIISALKYADADNISAIKELNVPLWNMVLQKILSIYFPDKFLTIGSPDVLIECARDIKIEGVDLTKNNSIQINYESKNKLSSQPELKDWPYDKLGTFIWKTYSVDTKRDFYILGSKYGERSDIDVFPQMLEKSVISTDFSSNIDLSELYNKNHSEITKYLAEQGEDSKSYNALKYFLTLKAGDRVAIKADGSPKGKKGFLSIVGIAEVIEKDGQIYRFEPNGLGHLINVKYLKAPVYKEFELGGYGRTIHKLSKPEHIELIFKTEYEEIPIDQLNSIPPEARVIYAYLKSSLSHRDIQKQILKEEAPARGGGYSTMKILRDYNIEGDKKGILNNVSFEEEYGAAEGQYHEALTLLRKHYPEFSQQKVTVMNPGYPLNTIIYGPPGTGKTYNTILRAAEIIENRSIKSYGEAKGIFNEHLGDRIEFITFHQNYSYEDFIQGLRPDVENDSLLTFERKDGVFKSISDRALENFRDSKKPSISKRPFEKTFRDYIKPLIEGEVEELEVSMKKVSYHITDVSEKSIKFRKASGGTSHTLSIATLKKMYESGTTLEIQGLSSYYAPLLESLLDIGKLAADERVTVEEKNYVIVIDEINRANISRVFGELITLIEPDKRFGREVALTCKLPSGEVFSVPPNLYIIGAMNTADKSIALLDIALRRRFEFEAMYPKYEIDGNHIYDIETLKKINKKIIELKGYDFQIGHAYFMGENKDLKSRMDKKVIPLLLEYFMNDDKEVRAILKFAELEVEENSWPLRIKG